jgi:hypothetical protein
MTDSASSTYELARLQPAGDGRITRRVASALRRWGDITSPARRSPRERYLGAAIDHADFERRSKIWDAYEESALRRASAGLYWSR